MKKTLTTYEIAHELMQDDNANWTRVGAFALAEYLQELEEDTGEEMEMDVVAIRCDFSQYDSLPDWGIEYFGSIEALNNEFGIFDIPEDLDEVIREYIQDNGQLIEFDGGVIVSSF
jgi:hypothetical protein